MSDLVVHQWGRLGDLIQTAVVINRWKKQVGGSISLTFDRRYCAVAQEILNIDHLFPIDIESIVSQTRVSAKQNDSLTEISDVLDKMQSARRGTHLVLSRSPSAALFSRLLEPETTLGFTWNSGHLTTPRILSEYLEGPNGEPYPVHLCDVWSIMAGLECGDLPNRTLDCDCNFDTENASAYRVIVFADAGEFRRSIPAKWLSELCLRLINNPNIRLTVVGNRAVTKGDAISELSRSGNGYLKDLRGRTSLDDLMKLVTAHDAVIASDTGGLHLATALGCVPIGLYTGGASVFNTGPYSKQAYVLQSPEWTNSEIFSISRLFDSLQKNRGDKNNVYDDSHFWTPYMDLSGIGFKNPAWDMSSKLEVEYLRNSLLQTRQTKVFAQETEN